MEQRAWEKGWNRPAKPVAPDSFENARAEISFLKGCEGYSRQTIHLCLEFIVNEKAYIESLESRRHRLEQMFVPVSNVKSIRQSKPKKAISLDNPENLTDEQLDEMLRLLEQLAEEGE
jgi:hypothetical protein